MFSPPDMHDIAQEAPALGVWTQSLNSSMCNVLHQLRCTLHVRWSMDSNMHWLVQLMTVLQHVP